MSCLSSWDQASNENEKQNKFVETYIQVHFGNDTKDIVYATSEALKAYYDSLGYKFGSDEESFILPILPLDKNQMK